MMCKLLVPYVRKPECLLTQEWPKKSALAVGSSLEGAVLARIHAEAEVSKRQDTTL